MRLGLTAGLLLILGTGCSRQAFRVRADKDVEAVITQKNVIPNAQVQNWHVYPDPRARFGEPPGMCQDYPPYPPDDYYAWLTSPNPQRPGRGGAGRYEGQLYLQQIAAWDASNRAQDEAERPKENPTGASIDRPDEKPKGGQKPADAEQGTSAVGSVAGSAVAGYLATFATEERPFRIRFEQAVELALFNSREFQDRREDLYLAALPVTFERFSFAAQAFAVENLIRQSTGRDFAAGRGSELWTVNTNVGFNRRFATGAQLLVSLANQVVIDLSGPRPTLSLSNLAVSFTQPFLRGGGYAVTLENLTQAERTLVYAIRSYARFRSVFYNAIVGNGDYTNNPYGLQGLSANLGRGVGANLTARATGFLPTILLAATLANQRKNVAALEDLLKLFENLKEGGGVNELQVNRVEQNLLQSRSQVLNSTRQYLDNVDFVKLQLGVPATLPLEFDDGPLRPVRIQLQNFERVYEQLREVEVAAGAFTPGEPAAGIRARWERLLTQSPLARGTPFAKGYPKRAEALRRTLDAGLTERLRQLADLRRVLLDARADRQLNNVPETPATLARLENLEGEVDSIRLEQALRRYEVAPWQRLEGARGGDPERPGKRDPLDPLLWSAERDGEPAWDGGALGRGRAGWHVECTAIARQHLGAHLDVLGGGSDLVFPHHEASAAHGDVLDGPPYARAYVHAGMVGLEGEKMSKSKGNLVLVSTLREAGVDPAAIRLAILAHHYRADWSWSADLLAAAQERAARWRAALAAETGPDATVVLAAVRARLADDLDAPGALAAVDEWVAAAEHGVLSTADAPALVSDVVDALLGVRL